MDGDMDSIRRKSAATEATDMESVVVKTGDMATADTESADTEPADTESTSIDDIDVNVDITATQALLGFDPRAVELAQEVLDQCRTSLMMTYRFLNVALWRMPFKPAPILAPIECDGVALWYNPFLVLYRFRQDSNELVRDMLHGIVHCVLRHPFDDTHENTRAWWLACDMAVEAMCMEMAGTAFPNELDSLRTLALEKFRSLNAVIAPERLYRILEADVRWMEVRPTEAGEVIKSLEFIFDRDSHAHWPSRNDDSNEDSDSDDQDSQATQDCRGMPVPSSADCAEEGGSAESDKDVKDGSNGSNNQSDHEPHDNASDESNANDENNELEQDEDQMDGCGKSDMTTPRLSCQETADDASSDDQNDESDRSSSLLDDLIDENKRASMEQEWENISKSVQEDLETFSRMQGSHSACFMANVAISNRKSIDYADFLRRFARLHEDMRVSDEEFDYVFYTYGLKLYGNMPLVEPLEYQEIERVRDFVIAIDTSSSCSEGLVQHFIDRTFQILTETEELRGAINVHIVQCDAAIQEDTKVSSLEQLKEFSNHFQIKGRGGTDFRPVFAYVDDLLAAGEFEELGGLIYFTDGYGTFPSHPPDYQTAFVFVEDEGDSRCVPAWAMKVVLRSEQVSIV